VRLVGNPLLVETPDFQQLQEASLKAPAGQIQKPGSFGIGNLEMEKENQEYVDNAIKLLQPEA